MALPGGKLFLPRFSNLAKVEGRLFQIGSAPLKFPKIAKSGMVASMCAS